MVLFVVVGLLLLLLLLLFLLLSGIYDPRGTPYVLRNDNLSDTVLKNKPIRERKSQNVNIRPGRDFIFVKDKNR